MNAESVDRFLREFTAWATGRPDIRAAALVGSYARGAARADSDVDLVIIAADPTRYLSDVSWICQFGKPEHHQTEDYGLVTSLRVWYRDGLEIEYGLTDERWAAVPLDEETRHVIEAGMRVLFERGGLLSRAAST